MNKKYDLNFDSALDSNLSLYSAEEKCQQTLCNMYKDYVHVWEYGYYFLTLFIYGSKVDEHLLVVASLFTEAHSALRGAFILNMAGYHGDSIVLLRKAHESVVRAIACYKNPKLTWKIVMEKSIESLETRYLKVEWKEIYRVESSFTHSNQIKSFQAGVDLQSKNDDVGVAWGPQIDSKLFNYSAKVSVFWLYVLIFLTPKLFQNHANEYWLSRHGASLEYLNDYLKESKSSLAGYCRDLDTIFAK